MALVLGDLGHKLRAWLKGRTIHLILTGEAGGCFTSGTNEQASAIIEAYALAINRIASGRISAEALAAQSTNKGDSPAATWFLKQADVLYQT